MDTNVKNVRYNNGGKLYEYKTNESGNVVHVEYVEYVKYAKKSTIINCTLLL